MNQADADASDPVVEDEGPGCLPGLIAAAALVLMGAFICCGVSTWYLYQQRGELARRTLVGSVIPELEQSDLPAEEKGAVIEQLRTVADEIEAGKLEDWQASGIMERLNRAALFEWGDLAAVEALIERSDAFDENQKIDAVKQLSRLRRAAELDKVTAVNFSRDVLAPVLMQASDLQRPSVRSDASPEQLGEVIENARLLADREEIPDEVFLVRLSDILEREIAAGKSVGGL